MGIFTRKLGNHEDFLRQQRLLESRRKRLWENAEDEHIDSSDKKLAREISSKFPDLKVKASTIRLENELDGIDDPVPDEENYSLVRVDFPNGLFCFITPGSKMGRFDIELFTEDGGDVRYLHANKKELFKETIPSIAKSGGDIY